LASRRSWTTHQARNLVEGFLTGAHKSPYKGFSVTKPLPPTPELIRVKCDAHEWMRAWIWEFDHPYYGTTDGDGHFRIPDVPPGTYTIVAWHEVMGQKEASVTVAPGKPVTVDFSFAPKK